MYEGYITNTEALSLAVALSLALALAHSGLDRILQKLGAWIKAQNKTTARLVALGSLVFLIFAAVVAERWISHIDVHAKGPLGAGFLALFFYSLYAYFDARAHHRSRQAERDAKSPQR
jgi:hypothetical protein